jgi:hypothetical protein
MSALSDMAIAAHWAAILSCNKSEPAEELLNTQFKSARSMQGVAINERWSAI